jgi:hypothetical protein
MGAEWTWGHLGTCLEGREISHVLLRPVLPGLSLLSYNYKSPSHISLGGGEVSCDSQDRGERDVEGKRN